MFESEYREKCSEALHNMLLRTLQHSTSDASSLQELVHKYYVPEEFYSYRHLHYQPVEKLKIFLNCKQEDDALIKNNYTQENESVSRIKIIYIKSLETDNKFCSLTDTIAKLIQDSIYYAEPEFLKTIIRLKDHYNTAFYFDLSNDEHLNLHKWITDNISRGLANKLVGWRCGPDSALWPSSELKDYQEILKFMKKMKWV